MLNQQAGTCISMEPFQCIGFESKFDVQKKCFVFTRCVDLIALNLHLIPNSKFNSDIPSVDQFLVESLVITASVLIT